MKKVTIFNSGVRNDVEVADNVNTWGALRNILEETYSNIDDMRAILRGTNTTLELEGAELPEGDIMIFLTARKTKSGSDMTRKGCYVYIQEVRSTSEEGHAFFAGYTNKTTGVLRDMIDEWDAANSEEAEFTFYDISNYLKDVHAIDISPEVLESDVIEYLRSQKENDILQAELDAIEAELN